MSNTNFFLPENSGVVMYRTLVKGAGILSSLPIVVISANVPYRKYSKSWVQKAKEFIAVSFSFVRKT